MVLYYVFVGIDTVVIKRFMPPVNTMMTYQSMRFYGGINLFLTTVSMPTKT